MFLPSVHGSFAKMLFIPIAAQLAIGIYLKLHIHEKSIRPYFVMAHGVIGKAYPILGWTQMIFGVAAFRGYCRGGHLGEAPLSFLQRSYWSSVFQDSVSHIISWVAALLHMLCL